MPGNYGNVPHRKKVFSDTSGVILRKDMILKWTEHVSNKEVLRIIQTKRKRLHIIRKR